MNDTPRTAALIEHARTMAEVMDSHEQMERELAAVTAERDALLAAIRQQWEFLPLLPTAPPGSYARGFDSGMRDTLTAIRTAIATSKEKP